MNQRLSGVSILLVGDREAQTSYSIYNQHIVDVLGSLGADVKSSANYNGNSDVDIVIHHEYQEDFSQFRRNMGAKFVAYRTWDFGPYPPRWVEKIEKEADQLWVYSHFTKEMAVSGGITASMIRVVPPIYNDKSLSPRGPAYPLKTDASLKFIFVGATVYRKGIDILLEAFTKAFTPKDDVALVVKDNPGDVFYKNLRYSDKIEAIVNDPNAPEVIYINEFLPPQKMADLYRACDVGVFPYRAEGYAIPIVELMASGKPSIVPDFGPCQDYTSHDNAFVVPARKFELPVYRQFSFNTLGFSEEIERVYFCELDPNELAEEMREIYRLDRNEIRQKGEKGTKYFVENFDERLFTDNLASWLEELV